MTIAGFGPLGNRKAAPPTIADGVIDATETHPKATRFASSITHDVEQL